MKIVINPSLNVGDWTWAGAAPHPAQSLRELDDGTQIDGLSGLCAHLDGTPLRMTAVAVKGRAVRLSDAP